MLVDLITIPLFTGAIGYVTNWSGVWMLFYPVQFKGFRLPGLRPLARMLPRKVQQIPGVMHGGVGWQGIIPSRAAKMGSISVDKGIAKLGGPSDFYEQIEPQKLAEHILVTAQGDIRGLVDSILEREQPVLWGSLPPQIREAVHARVAEQLPEIVSSLMDEIGHNIDSLMDVKLMVIRQMEEQPQLASKIFSAVSTRELKFIVNFGFWFGLLLGFPLVFITEGPLPYWWALPIGGTLIGWTTNYLGIAMIFEPVEPRSVLGFRVQGLFLRRQAEVAEVYSKIISEDVITLNAMGTELLTGPSSDRTRRLISDSLRPSVDRAVGRARGLVRTAIGSREYDTIRDSVATEAVEYTMEPLRDPEFNARQGERIRELIGARMKEMSPHDFTEMLRTVIKQDEWLLFLHGAVLGFGAGLIHLAIFG